MQVAIQLSNWQLAILVVLPALVSLTGFVTNNYRIGDLNSRLGDLKADVLHLNGRIDQLIGAVNEVDKRLIVVEARLKIE